MRVLRFARAGFKQPQQLTLLAYLQSLGARPDVVVNLDGFNELVATHNNPKYKTRPSYPSAAHWNSLSAGRDLDRTGVDLLIAIREEQRRAVRQAEQVSSRGLCRSALLGRWAHERQIATYNRWRAAQSAFVDYLANRRQEGRADGLDAMPAPGELMGTALRAWFQSSLSMQALCDSRGVLFVHALQPALLEDGSKPITAAEREKGLGPGSPHPAVIDGYPRLREMGRALVQNGVGFVDLTQMFAGVEETLYYDSCHFGRAGNLILAERLAEAILERLGTSED